MGDGFGDIGVGAPGDDEPSVRPMLVAAVGVACLGTTVGATAHGLDRFVFGSGGLAAWTALCLAIAATLFVTAGVLRLVRWRLVQDTHSVLAGSALVVMGGLCLPIGGFMRVLLPTGSELVGPLARCAAAAVAMLLVVQALRSSEVDRRHRPDRLLALRFGVVALVLVALLGVVSARPGLLEAVSFSPAVPPMLLSTGWLVLAVLTGLRCGRLPWACRTAPLLFGMALAEAMRALDFGDVGSWTLGGVLLCTSLGVLSVRAALVDLNTAVRADEHDHARLSLALASSSRETESLTRWREQFTHDARNVLAGLHAAVEVMSHHEALSDPVGTARLRLAAESEIEQLTHMLEHASTRPDRETFDAAEVVRRAAACASMLGTSVRVRGARAVAVGRPGDLAAALQSLLVNARTHAPGSRVELHVTSRADRVCVVCADDGPGLTGADVSRIFDRGYRGATSAGSGLGLYAARRLMREQGGDLVVESTSRGATFVLSVPAAAGGPARMSVPAQRAVRTTGTAMGLASCAGPAGAAPSPTEGRV